MDNPIQYIRVTGLKAPASTSITHRLAHLQVRHVSLANPSSTTTSPDGASTAASAGFGGTLQVLQLKLNRR